MKIVYKYIAIVLLLANTSCVNRNSNLTKEKAATIANANLQLGIAYLEQKEYERSLEKLERARQADPDNTDVYNVLGLLYQQLEQYAIAEKNFKHALKIDPKDAKTLNNYGQLLCKQGQYDMAEKLFLRAIENPLYETPELVYTNAGLCAQLHNKEDIAAFYYRQALLLEPMMPQALLNMAALSANKEDWIAAHDYFQRYQKIGRHSASSLWLGIRIGQQLGNANAVASYGLLLKNQFPDSPEAQLYKQQRGQ